MSSSVIAEYTETKSTADGGGVKDNIYNVRFKLVNSSNSMANAIRRVLLSGIPVVAFDDTYYENHSDIKLEIYKNVSALHNEFIAHRISLLPICMYKNSSLTIVIDYNFDTAEYKYMFKNEDAVPTFRLMVKNDAATRERLHATSTIDVISSLITIQNEEEFNPVSEFIIGDYMTGDYCLIHRLKPISSNEDVQEAEELDILMKPTISTARKHARYCPVGTVSYEFDKDTPEKQELYFQAYMSNLQEQRKSDGLPEYNEKDEKLFRGTFTNLGSERIYKKQKDGDAETVKFTVESIGNLESHQLVFDALEIIKLKTLLLLNHFIWNERLGKYTYSDKKISINTNATSGNIEITIFKEDHTLGNLIGSYLKKLFITNKDIGDLLTFATYKLPHPLEDKIVIIIGFKENVDLNGLFTRFGFKSTSDNIVKAIQLMFITCSYYLKHLSQITTEWSNVSSIVKSSFELAEGNELLTSSYYNKSDIM